MKFEYDVLNDYRKIAENITKYNLRKECLEKLHELGITRVGEILACSETAVDTYGKNAKWVKEAKDHFTDKVGELEIWEVLEYLTFDEEDFDEDEFEMYDCIDEDEPLEILDGIISGVFDKCLTEYELKTGKKLSVEDLELSDKIDFQSKKSGSDILSFFVLSSKKLMEYSNPTLDSNTITEVRKYLSELISLPEGIFELLDEIDDKQMLNFQELLKENQTDNSSTQKSTLKAGDKITHSQHGNGCVVDCSSGYVTVRFESGKEIKFDTDLFLKSKYVTITF